MQYRNDNGEITNYNLEILLKNDEPFAVVVTGENKGTEISQELGIKSAKIAAELHSYNRGLMTVFTEKSNGHFQDTQVEILTPHRNIEAQRVLDKSNENHIVSKNNVDMYREKADEIIQSGKTANKPEDRTEAPETDLSREEFNLQEIREEFLNSPSDPPDDSPSSAEQQKKK